MVEAGVDRRLCRVRPLLSHPCSPSAYTRGANTRLLVSSPPPLSPRLSSTPRGPTTRMPPATLPVMPPSLPPILCIISRHLRPTPSWPNFRLLVFSHCSFQVPVQLWYFRVTNSSFSTGFWPSPGLPLQHCVHSPFHDPLRSLPRHWNLHCKNF